MSYSLVICDGIHPPQWTEDFLHSWNDCPIDIKRDYDLILSPRLSPAYDGLSIYQLIVTNYQQTNSTKPLIFIGFSAGVVGALIASRLWQRHRVSPVLALIAIDGWGVPLIADFPIYTLSHDYFTHLTLIKFNPYCDSFYADPSVSHEQIWRSPSNTLGWWQTANGRKQRNKAIAMIKFCLEKYQ
jgi:hypothetical protein